jgi:hypothetical protein
MKKSFMTGVKNQRGIFFILIILSIVFISLIGCTESRKGGKTEEKKGQSPALKIEPKSLGCQVFDKLPGDIAIPLEVNYGGKIKLLGVTIDKKSLPKQLEIAYFWQSLQDLGAYQTVFVHFRDSQRNLLFQNDHDFCPDYSFHEKIKGKFIKENFLIYISALKPGTKLDIKVGIYDPVSGKNLAIQSSGKTPTDYENAAADIKNAL